MTDIPKTMTERQAYQYYDFCEFRLFGWMVAARVGKHHRSKAVRAADTFWRRTISEGPRPNVFADAAMTGESVVDLYPEDMRVEIERQFNTKVPRTINEPTSPEFIKSMHEGGRTDWVLPDYLANHGRDS